MAAIVARVAQFVNWYAEWWYLITPLVAILLSLLVYRLASVHRLEIALTVGLMVLALSAFILGEHTAVAAPSITLKIAGVASDGKRVLVSDTQANRVVELDVNTWRPIRTWNTGLFERPAGLAIEGDQVLVTDPFNNRIANLSATTDTAGPPVNPPLDRSYFYPNDVAIKQESWYIADSGNNRVVAIGPYKVTSSLDVNRPGMPPFSHPLGVGLHPSQPLLYVADTGNNKVEVIDTALLTLTMSIPVSVTSWSNISVPISDSMPVTATRVYVDDAPESRLKAPADVAVAANGRIYVADTDNHRIAVYDTDGEYIREIKTIKDFDGAFTPVSLAIGPKDYLLAVDKDKDQLLVIGPEDKLIAKVSEITQPFPWVAWFFSWLGGLCLVVVAALATAGINSAIISGWFGLRWVESFKSLIGAWAAAWGYEELFRAFQSVVDGKLQGDGGLRRPGPALVIIGGASAVVFELGGKISRVAGPGAVVTKRWEVIRAVFDLRPQSKTMDLTGETIYSREGVELHVKFSILYRIQQDEAVLVSRGQYKVPDDALRRATLNVAENDWTTQTEQAAKAVLREVISARSLEEIFDPRTSRGNQTMPRAPLQYEIQRRLTFVTQQWGVEVVRVTLDEITLPREVRQRLLDAWDVQWHREVELGRVETEVLKLLKQLEGKRDEAQAKAEAEMILADSKGYANTVEGRSRALARVEYVLQLLKAFGGKEDPLKNPDTLKMIVNWAAVADIDNARTLAGLLTTLGVRGLLDGSSASNSPSSPVPNGSKSTT